ncbi:glutathione S- transferase, nitrogen catabolite repression regulator [Neocucurbitaria cava]|uniref:Glutathione S- transferase, nitrogen catabolite repression regulator n=1 Tax=Neocucurbitaria cava TaxID=798079 RepID=A0A9W9CL42_9PLEO|nr:glutathione S- transferase, nitrogen catabolite repression regulator [Neocucurbitaria cava]
MSSSTSTLKPITIHGKRGPNPPKIAMLCEELGLPYEALDTEHASLKTPQFLALNPNGRMPVIHDPNTGYTIWESGAIILYLMERYDTDKKLSFPQGSEESYLAQQWLFFQVSGQGPYYGQGVWFTRYHAEQLPSAQERYYNEIRRVTGVVEGHLKKQRASGEEGKDEGPWLVGGKFSYADLAWFSWQNLTMELLAAKVDLSEFTETAGWIGRMKARPGFKKVLEESAIKAA